jgi:hypothetical protein
LKGMVLNGSGNSRKEKDEMPLKIIPAILT